MANKTISFLRNIFKRDNYHAGREDGQANRASQYHALSNGLLGQGMLGTQQSIYGGDHNDQSMSDDLLTRYADYESMDDVPELSTALDIVADDATQSDHINGHAVHIKAEDGKIAELLETAFHDNIRIDEHIWEIARVLCKYGNNFEEHIITPNEGLIGLKFLSPPQVRRIDDEDDSLLGFVYDRSGQFAISTEEFEARLKNRELNDRMFFESGRNTNVYEDWELTHFRLRSKQRGSQYGWSFLESARWTVKRLLMLEDAAILYKLSRAPQRFVFNVDVGDLPPNEALRYVENVKKKLKKEKIVNPKTGKLDLTSNTWANDEDFFIPTRKDKPSMSVDSVGGFDAAFYMDDIEYFKDKLYAALKIPKDYLNYSEDSVSKANLCVVPETKIPLIDGRTVTMEQLIQEHREGRENYVYSVDENGNFKSGKITNALWTRKNTQVLRVRLDNNEYLDCTPDHPIMMRNGEYVKAEDLAPGDSLMPYYVRKSTGKLEGYTEILNPSTEKYVMVHRLVCDQFNKDRNNKVIHHRDFNKLNNQISFMDFANQYLGGYKLCRKGHSYNHKVISVELLEDKRDTCDITVEKYHNFAIESGIVIHNSTEDMRFARTIIRVQRALRTGLVNMGRVHLAALSYDPDLVDFDIFLTPPSSIFEMAMMEVKQAQLDIAENFRAFVDDYWIMTNILKFDDQEIEEIQQRLKKQNEADDPFAEQRFPNFESRQRKMNPEIKKMLEDHGSEVLLKDKGPVGQRLRELKELSMEIKGLLTKK